MKRVWQFVKASIRHWNDHQAQSAGAALSYYAIFSLVPLLGLVIFLGGTLLDRSAVQTEAFRQVAGFIGSEPANYLQGILSNLHPAGLTSIQAVIGIGILAAGALGGLVQLQSTLNRFWQADPRAKLRGWKQAWGYMLPRLVSLSLVPILALLLIVSLLGSTIIDLVTDIVGHGIIIDPLISLAKELLPFVFAAALFTYTFRYLSRVRMEWREAVAGGLFTSLLFIAAKNLIDFYLTHFAGTGTFGTAGTLVAIMIWIYLSVQLFLLGASATYVYAKTYGSLKDKEDA